MPYFFDTSAIVKIYHDEAGSEVVLPIYKNEKFIFISELSKVEFLSTIHKKFRNKEINKLALGALKEKFLSDSADKFRIIPIASSVIDIALELITRHGKSNALLSLDAIQLAAFFIINDNHNSFVCSDKRLTQLVKQLGWTVLSL